MTQHPLRLLLVEDDDGLRQMTAIRLRHLGHEVTLVENGIQALEVIQGQSFDLMLLDIQMPGMDGLEVLKRLRANPSTKDLPVLVVSASDTAAGMRAGADHFIGKPYGRKELADAIQHTFRMRATTPGEQTE